MSIQHVMAIRCVGQVSRKYYTTGAICTRIQQYARQPLIFQPSGNSNFDILPRNVSSRIIQKVRRAPLYISVYYIRTTRLIALMFWVSRGKVEIIIGRRTEEGHILIIVVICVWNSIHQPCSNTMYRGAKRSKRMSKSVRIVRKP